jgi:uncharacterized protein (DUF2235 family)
MLGRDPRQIAYYDAGVGTLVDPAAISSYRKCLSRRLDAAIGMRVRENVIAAYRFLARTYQPGDQIYLFGFSRGAYTARALAGLIQFLGLVLPEQENLAFLAWSLFANEAHAYQISRRFAGGNRFNRSFGVPEKPAIHFVGVWDTVSSFGWIWDYKTLPHTTINPSITHFRHAMAIDERRALFPVSLFRPKPSQESNCKQVWFAGSHGDVGGGYPEAESMNAKVSLAWMLREAETHGLHINDTERNYLMNSKDKPGPDPCGPIHDALIGYWKLMEYLPRRSWNGKAEGMRWQGPHLGRRRLIDAGCVVHASVMKRMHEASYSPPNLPKVTRVED